MQCFLVVTTDATLPSTIPEQYRENTVRLSGDHACIVGSADATTEDIAAAFDIAINAPANRRGMVVKLDYYSGWEKAEVVDKFRRIKEK